MAGADGGAGPGAGAGWRWDVALSFAGAQRDYVEQVAQVLKARGYAASTTPTSDICPGAGQLLIRPDPLTAPRRTQALAALCDQLSSIGARYPGTDLALRYEVKDHSGTA